MGGILDGILIANCNPSDVEARVFLKMKADYHRYMTECTSGSAKTAAASQAKAAYEEASRIVAFSGLALDHPLRLGLALNYSVFLYEVLGLIEDACERARG